jgi:hypothetical protein
MSYDVSPQSVAEDRWVDARLKEGVLKPLRSEKPVDPHKLAPANKREAATFVSTFNRVVVDSSVMWTLSRREQQNLARGLGVQIPRRKRVPRKQDDQSRGIRRTLRKSGHLLLAWGKLPQEKDGRKWFEWVVRPVATLEEGIALVQNEGFRGVWSNHPLEGGVREVLGVVYPPEEKLPRGVGTHATGKRGRDGDTPSEEVFPCENPTNGQAILTRMRDAQERDTVSRDEETPDGVVDADGLIHPFCVSDTPLEDATKGRGCKYLWLRDTADERSIAPPKVYPPVEPVARPTSGELWRTAIERGRAAFRGLLKSPCYRVGMQIYM